jgi:NADH:ubiquinone oxidoreductase subunit E
VRTDRIPGLGVAKGLVFAVTQIFRPKATIQYPEQHNPVSPRHRGRLILLYDEAGTLKCETCFQCAAACPIECIDMGGVDTRQRYHVHWGPAEQYAERREESALRRSGRPVPDATFEPFATIDLAPLDAILARHGFRPRSALRILEETQDAYGHLPVAALQHIAFRTGAWYSELYGIATSYPHLRFEAPTAHLVQVCRCAQCLVLGGGAVLAAFREHLGTDVGGISPDGTVRLEATDCRGGSRRTPRVLVDGNVLPKASPKDAATIAAALRGTAVPQGRRA